jgi:hypothetical protein
MFAADCGLPPPDLSRPRDVTNSLTDDVIKDHTHGTVGQGKSTEGLKVALFETIMQYAPIHKYHNYVVDFVIDQGGVGACRKTQLKLFHFEETFNTQYLIRFAIPDLLFQIYAN